MKQAKSNLIAAFLFNVQDGLVVGRDSSSGPVILRRMVAALEAIIDGADPDTALEITRAPGQPADPSTLALALLIHRHRKAKEKWAVVEIIANEWLTSIGREQVSLPRLKAIYKAHKRAIEQREQADLLIARIQAAIAGDKK